MPLKIIGDEKVLKEKDFDTLIPRKTIIKMVQNFIKNEERHTIKPYPIHFCTTNT